MVPLAKGPDPHFRLFSFSIWVPLFQIPIFSSVWIQEFDSHLNSTSSQLISSGWVSWPCCFGVNSATTWQHREGEEQLFLWVMGEAGAWQICIATSTQGKAITAPHHARKPSQIQFHQILSYIYICIRYLCRYRYFKRYLRHLNIYTYIDIYAYTHKYIFFYGMQEEAWGASCGNRCLQKCRRSYGVYCGFDRMCLDGI